MSLRDLVRRLRVLALLAHVAAAAVWIFVMAGGFPILHLRFLANRGLPAAVILLGIAGVFAARKESTRILRAIILTLAIGWGAASLTGIVLFPISGRIPFVLGMMCAFVMLVLAFERASGKSLRSPLTIGLCFLGIIGGALAPFTQRAAQATTHPIGGSTTQSSGESTTGGSLWPQPLSKSLRVVPADGSLTLMRDELMITVQPMLTFISRSPDRCWTLLAPYSRRAAPPRRLTQWSRADPAITLRYADLGITDLTIAVEGNDTARVEAVTELPREIYSHLNTFCEISVSGHSKLSIKFSPCPGEAIEVTPMDYPVGRPARFAYLDASGVFRVVQATSAEKGPFHELASGKLERTQTLEMTLLDDGRPIASIALADWAAQASADLSPTAGWGVPQNSIEFSLDGEYSRSPASIFVTLASTSVGRGFDSVGHAPGIYRNRMTMKLLSP